MNRRTRTLAGFLTLSAMTFSFAETVYASMCTSVGGMAEMGEMAGGMTDRVPEMDDVSAEHAQPDHSDCLLMSGQEQHAGGGERGPHCPLSPAVGAGCIAVASLPAPQIAALPWTAGDPPVRASDDARPDLLLTHGLFRPPRA